MTNPTNDDDGGGAAARGPGKARLLELATTWRSLILARGSGQEYAAQRHAELCRLLAETDYALDDSAVVIAIGRLRDAGKSLCTCNKYLTTIKSFTRWLSRPSARVLPFDPLVEIPKFNARRDRRHERTSFVPVLERLLAATEKSTRAYRGVSGVDRAELYHAAACTGLREGTLVVIETSQFHFDVDPAVVRVRADQLKDGEDLVVPIQADSAARLRAYLAGKMPTARAFRTPPHDYDFARMLRKDLTEAGIPYCRRVPLANGRTRREQVLDFHALRGTFNTWCADAGVELTVRQGWMGHSDPKLTANTYTYRLPTAQAAAVRQLPPLPGVRRAG